ncbi:MAG: hypothetical protein JWM00_41 [Candidatus Saccharibacteria bacterium]|nr:hypothetical protein [Candidatus Saccharibacteria bacterium]
MNVQITNKQKGFTIIEVVLVLAIAGLIFLMVFIALPALQRSQRDTQRRNDLSRAQTAVNNYRTSNRNALPTVSDFNTRVRDTYLKADGDTFEDPTRGEYFFVAGKGAGQYPAYLQTGAVGEAEIWVDLSTKCKGEDVMPSGSRSVALRMALEGGGTACLGV